jgi:hypothetical protein
MNVYVLACMGDKFSVNTDHLIAVVMGKVDIAHILCLFNLCQLCWVYLHLKNCSMRTKDMTDRFFFNMIKI